MVPAAQYPLSSGRVLRRNTEVLPDADTSIDLGIESGRLEWLASIRHLNFDTSSTFIWSPGLTISLNDRVAVTLRYYHSESDFDTFRAVTGNDGGSLKATGRIGRRLWIEGGYVRGFEALALITAERTTQFGADNVSGGIRFDATPFTSIGGVFEYQWRELDTHVATAAINFIQRF